MAKCSNNGANYETLRQLSPLLRDSWQPRGLHIPWADFHKVGWPQESIWATCLQSANKQVSNTLQELTFVFGNDAGQTVRRHKSTSLVFGLLSGPSLPSHRVIEVHACSPSALDD